MGDAVEKSLEGELEKCKPFLVDTDIEKGKHRVYIFAKKILDPKLLLETLDTLFDSLNQMCS